MGSYSEETNLLEYLRSKSQVDCDCLDTDRRVSTSFLDLFEALQRDTRLTDLCKKIVAKSLGKFVDSTSNQVGFNQSCTSANTDRFVC